MTQQSRIYGTRMQNLELLEEKSASYLGYLRSFMSVSSLYVSLVFIVTHGKAEKCSTHSAL